MGWGGERREGFPRGSWKGYAKANTEGNDPIAKGLSFLMIVLTQNYLPFLKKIKMRISKSAMSDMIQKLGSYHHFWYFCPEVFKEGKTLKWKHQQKRRISWVTSWLIILALVLAWYTVAQGPISLDLVSFQPEGVDLSPGSLVSLSSLQPLFGYLVISFLKLDVDTRGWPRVDNCTQEGMSWSRSMAEKWHMIEWAD